MNDDPDLDLPTTKPHRNLNPKRFTEELREEFAALIASGKTAEEIFLSERAKVLIARNDAQRQRWLSREARTNFARALALLETQVQKGESK